MASGASAFLQVVGVSEGRSLRAATPSGGSGLGRLPDRTLPFRWSITTVSSQGDWGVSAPIIHAPPFVRMLPWRNNIRRPAVSQAVRRATPRAVIRAVLALSDIDSNDGVRRRYPY